jgi:hypothetical protein
MNIQETTDNILKEADQIVGGARQKDYGNPAANHRRTAILIQAYIASKYGIVIPFTPEDVCFVNILQKISRHMNAPKRDNLVDIAGYTLNVQLIEDHEKAIKDTQHLPD